MALKDLMEEENATVEFEYLSTHPSNQKRSLALEQLLEEALKCRDECKCPPLQSDVDPLKAAHTMRNCINNVRERQTIMQEINHMVSEKVEEDDKLSSEEKENLNNNLKTLRSRLKQLELEYMLMIRPQPQQDKNKEKKPEQSNGVHHNFWNKIFSMVSTTGQLTDTIFDRKLELSSVKNEDLKKTL